MQLTERLGNVAGRLAVLSQIRETNLGMVRQGERARLGGHRHRLGDNIDLVGNV